MVDYILICGFRHLLNDTTVWLMCLDSTCIHVWIADLPTSATVTFFFFLTVQLLHNYTLMSWCQCLNTYHSVSSFFCYIMSNNTPSLPRQKAFLYCGRWQALLLLTSWLPHLCMAPRLCLHIWEEKRAHSFSTCSDITHGCTRQRTACALDGGEKGRGGVGGEV